MSHTREASEKILAEIQAVVLGASREFASALPENNYMAFSLYTMILPAVFSEISHIALPEPGALGPMWNYLDASCSAILGVNQLLDTQSHRPVATKMKGLFNIGVGAEVATLTTLNFAVLGGPAFAAALGTGFIISLDDTVCAFARKYDFDYWLKDSLAQLEKLEALKAALKNEIFELTVAETAALGRWVLNRKKERLAQMEATKKELEKDILFRVAAKRYERSEADLSLDDISTLVLRDSDAAIEARLNACGHDIQQTKFIKDLRAINNWDMQKPLTLARHDLVSEFDNASDLVTREVRKQEIEKKCNAKIQHAVKDSFMWGIAFTGALLMCIPGCQLPGLIIMGVASAMYLAKNAEKIGSALKKGFSYFFGSAQNETNGAPNADRSYNDNAYSPAINVHRYAV
jgi:hypothetical protein